VVRGNGGQEGSSRQGVAERGYMITCSSATRLSWLPMVLLGSQVEQSHTESTIQQRKQFLHHLLVIY